MNHNNGYTQTKKMTSDSITKDVIDLPAFRPSPTFVVDSISTWSPKKSPKPLALLQKHKKDKPSLGFWDHKKAVTANMANHFVSRILIDNESSCDMIILESTWDRDYT